jgi:hypothetical protein
MQKRIRSIDQRECAWDSNNKFVHLTLRTNGRGVRGCSQRTWSTLPSVHERKRHSPNRGRHYLEDEQATLSAQVNLEIEHI